MLQFIRGNKMKKKEQEKKELTIKLYEAIFIGGVILFLLYIILAKFITPNIG